MNSVLRQSEAGESVVPRSRLSLVSPKPEGYRQCGRCVMDTSDPAISFNEDGYCCHCTDYLEKKIGHTYRGRESDDELESLFDSVRAAGRGNTYDCVIGVSGGTDSSYLAHLTKQHNLRPLAVHMDNGWNSEKAVINIRNVMRGLDIDYQSYVLDWEEFKDLQLAFLKASVPEVETPTDIAIPAALYLFAARHGIKYILSGGNLTTEGMLPATWHYDVRDMKYFRHIHRKFGTTPLRKFPAFGYKREIWWKVFRGIRTVYPLDLVPYDKNAARDFLAENFDWKCYGGKHHESRYTKFIQSYYLVEKFNIDYRRVELSLEICRGKTDRATAAGETAGTCLRSAEIADDKLYIAKKFGIDPAELEHILNLPGRWSWDYPNEQRKLAFLYDMYRWIFKKEKLDRF